MTNVTILSISDRLRRYSALYVEQRQNTKLGQPKVTLHSRSRHLAAIASFLVIGLAILFKGISVAASSNFELWLGNILLL